MGKLTPEEAFGQILRELRKSKNFSQEKLSFESGLDRTFISHLEGGRKQPSLSTIFQLAHAFKIPASKLIAAVEGKLNEDSAD